MKVAIETLVIKNGNSSLIIGADGKIECDQKVTLTTSGSTLTISAGSAGVILMGGGGGGKKGSSVMFVEGVTMNGGYICANDYSTTNVYVDGKKVTTQRHGQPTVVLVEPEPARDQGAVPSEPSFLPADCQAKVVRVSGSGRVFIDQKWISSSVEIESTGSGEFWINDDALREFDSIQVQVKGSGSVSLGVCRTKTLGVQISGSGEVSDVKFLLAGSFAVSGSGCVVALAAKGAVHTKSVSGSGTVRIEQD